MRALISVADKAGIVELAQWLVGMGFDLISTGGSARVLAQAGLPVTPVATVTQSPEILDGRVKTLHPKIHAGLLARRALPEHRAALAAHNIATIDLLVVNFYPFEATVANPHCSLESAIENIDIGGPAMVRSAAKNWQDVVVLTDPSQYPAVMLEWRDCGQVSQATRFALAVAAFNRISTYDAAISNCLSGWLHDPSQPLQTDQHLEFPGQLNLNFAKISDLRYGENPHQRAAFYRDPNPALGSIATARLLQGKELSYNNIADADAAWECAKGFEPPVCVIVKHANPCGVAQAGGALQAYQKALQTDPTSAFGGIVAFNRLVDRDTAELLNQTFFEVLLAPAYTQTALEVLRAKPKLRVLQIEWPADVATSRNRQDIKRVGSGLLVQSADVCRLNPSDLQVVTQVQPTEQQWNDLMFAWQVAACVKSNAIVYCAHGMTLGIGAGQTSRIDSARIAGLKATHAGLSLHGSAVASDAFFPFRDGLDTVAEQGATSIIQPGGSIRDAEVIAAANERGVAMVFTGVRHFRH